jgi:hypothetical protein
MPQDGRTCAAHLPLTQFCEQQSPSLQLSSILAHCLVRHREPLPTLKQYFEQHSDLTLQTSPVTEQVPGLSHMPLVQWFEQQSWSELHALPWMEQGAVLAQ